ncbi:MAG: methyltransferase domain-containing protein [Pyramidobacter sp.]|nr:methyltransferase domain-containing protein [Pyramidobacter sp.]
MGVNVRDEAGEAILYGFLNMLQPQDGPRVNMDTVLLAGFAELKEGERAIELGCAHGAVTLILAKRHPRASVEGLDIQPELIELARENAARNSLTANTRFCAADLREYRRLYPHQSFDALVVNPPYEDPGFGRRSESETNRVARQGEQCTLADVCAAAKYLLKNKGRLYMVMRALRMAETMTALQTHGLSPRKLLMVHPAPGKNASVFLVEARRNGGPALTVLPPLYIYGEDGEYTAELMRCYTPEGPERS